MIKNCVNIRSGWGTRKTTPSLNYVLHRCSDKTLNNTLKALNTFDYGSYIIPPAMPAGEEALRSWCREINSALMNVPMPYLFYAPARSIRVIWNIAVDVHARFRGMPEHCCLYLTHLMVKGLDPLRRDLFLSKLLYKACGEFDFDIVIRDGRQTFRLI